MKTRLSIDTDFEFYRAIIARTQNSIADDDFIVHCGDINKPEYKYQNYKFYNQFQQDSRKRNTALKNECRIPNNHIQYLNHHIRISNFKYCFMHSKLNIRSAQTRHDST